MKRNAAFDEITDIPLKNRRTSTSNCYVLCEESPTDFDPEQMEISDGETKDPSERPFMFPTIGDLPPELLVEIFSYLTVRELCSGVSQVCQKWNLLSRHHCLWRHLSFRGDQVHTENLCSLLNNATQLRSLQLVDRADAAAVLSQVARSNRNLRTLVLKGCMGSPLQARIKEQVLLRLIRRCTRLEEVTIKETDFHTEKLFQILPTCNGSLKTLKLTGWGLTNEAMSGIVKCIHLQILRIHYARSLTDDGIFMLPSLHKLYSLELSSAIGVSVIGWCDVFNRGNFNFLKKLCLNSNNTVNDTVLESIGVNCPILEKISLSFCCLITNQGVTKVLMGCNALKLLILDFVNINVTQSFPLIPKYVPGLIRLDYDFDLSVEQLVLENVRSILDDLQEKLPNLIIRNCIQ